MTALCTERFIQRMITSNSKRTYIHWRDGQTPGAWTLMSLKCAVMSVTLKRQPSLYEYKMKGQVIPRVDHHDYLGVTISQKLSWDLHTRRISSKALRTLGMLRRNLHSCSPGNKGPSLSYLSKTTAGIRFMCMVSTHQETYKVN
jgi:hypothetical protein